MTDEIKPDVKPDDVPPIDLGEGTAPAEFDWKSLEEDVSKTGEVSEELLAKAKASADPLLVDEKVARLKAEHKLKGFEGYAKEKADRDAAVKDTNEFIFKSFGGAEEFKTISETLRKDLSKDILDSINAKLTSGNKLLVAEGVKIAQSEYKKLKGIGGVIMGDAVSQPQDRELMLTKEDYRIIMRTEKYKTDPQYRQKMDEARLKTKKADKEKYGSGQYYGFNQNGRYEL